MSHPRLTSIQPLDDYILRGTFSDHSVRLYDVKPLINRIAAFQDLVNIHHLFEQVQLDAGGYGATWNDELDLDAAEIYSHGQVVTNQFV